MATARGLGGSFKKAAEVLPARGWIFAADEDVGMRDWSGSDDLKGITGVSGNQFTAGSAVIVVRQIIVVVVFQFQVQMPTRWIFSLCPLHS